MNIISINGDSSPKRKMGVMQNKPGSSFTDRGEFGLTNVNGELATPVKVG